MASYYQHRTRQLRRGATTLELALTLPIFLMLLIGTIEFGRGFMVQQLVTNASRVGAREGTLPGSTNDEVAAKVRAYLTTGKIDSDKVKVTVTPENLQSAKTGTQVKVQVGVAFSDVSWMPVPRYLGRTNLTSESVMRHE